MYACRGLLRKEVKTPRSGCTQGLICYFSKEWQIAETNQTKEEGGSFVVLGEVNCGKVNTWGKLIKDKGYLVGFVGW